MTIFTDIDAAIEEAEFLANKTGRKHAVCDTEKGIVIVPVSEAKALKLDILETVEAVA